MHVVRVIGCPTEKLTGMSVLTSIMAERIFKFKNTFFPLFPSKPPPPPLPKKTLNNTTGTKQGQLQRRNTGKCLQFPTNFTTAFTVTGLLILKTQILLLTPELLALAFLLLPDNAQPVHIALHVTALIL
jgi:hypothetical protein